MQRGLSLEVVDAVDEPVAVGRNDLRRVLGRHEDRLHLDAAVGIDEQAALPEHLGLRASVGALKGGQLAVRVRERHIVAVDQRDAAHRRADQSLHDPAADAAQPHHGHMRAGEAPGALLAEKTAHASESPRVSRHAHISSPFVRTIRFLKCE